ncbi:long-chain-fatty-acid--CoA ligase [Candidatus Poribacteria bacterium]|nr:long-chain-fatty-acid--CoA ligase [Candidatus Poribacteria bacterium]
MRNLSDDLVNETYNGIQVLNFKRRPRNIREILQTSTERFPDKNAFECNLDVRTYSEFSRDVDRLASAMQKTLGVRKGERVALLLGNDTAFPLSLFAASRIGAVSVPINTRFVTNEIAFVINNCSASVVVVHPNYLKECLRAKRSAPALKHVVVAGSAGSTPDCLELASLVKSSDVQPDEVEVHENDLACIFYTAGTMGKTKGALCSHRNIVSNCLNVEAVTGITSDDRQLVCVPFFHPTGCHAQLIGGVHVGCTTVIERHFNADETLTLVQKAKITRLVGVPTIYWLLLAQMNLKDYDCSSVNSVIYGGAPASPELVRRLREAFPSARLGNGYGLTESSSLATFLPDEFALEKSDSVGSPVPTVEVRIVNEEGLELAPGRIGEVLLKGPNIVNGYWQDSEATRETFSHGWLRTGDLGRIDGDGFLYVVDRKKDIIIRGGENIYSVEIENVLESHPGVFEAAVVGEPDKVFGEQVKAYIVPNPGSSLSMDEILDFCDEHLADFKIPKYVEFVEALPRNAAGKVDKRALRR